MKHRFHVFFAFVAASGIGMAACSSGSTADAPPAPGSKPLNIITQTSTAIEGSFADELASLRFKSVEHAPRKVEVSIRAGATELLMHLDYEKGEGEFDANSGRLDQAQVDAMLHLMTALAEVLPSEDTNATLALGRTLNFYSDFPVATELPTFKFVSENGWAYIQCHCHYQNAEGYQNWMGQGESCGTSAAPHCPGRCGKGCGPDNLRLLRWGSGKYTADCAKHDYGVGSLPAAADDYEFASFNCPSGI